MNFVHTVGVKVGSDQAKQDVFIVAKKAAIPNVIGGAPGASVTTAVAFIDLPATYGVAVTPNQDAVCYVTNKTAAGFNVVMNPRLAANTLAAGTFDVLLTA